MADVDRSAYNDIMIAFENKIGEIIVEEAQKFDLKKIEAYIVLENVLEIMREDIKKERQKK